MRLRDWHDASAANNVEFKTRIPNFNFAPVPWTSNLLKLDSAILSSRFHGLKIWGGLPDYVRYCGRTFTLRRRNGLPCRNAFQVGTGLILLKVRRGGCEVSDRPSMDEAAARSLSRTEEVEENFGEEFLALGPGFWWERWPGSILGTESIQGKTVCSIND